jgi:hypothetical protein
LQAKLQGLRNKAMEKELQIVYLESELLKIELHYSCTNQSDKSVDDIVAQNAIIR